ncbi:uncharacterized protein BcabD6B2_14930 [Babesia caballi]|uniref:Uncharacterized protein n=1 Tax=Babesia caballi TaxID=5871 RepID=A0AAV4LQQ3_BABCB|nr:hypothetical protein BcabD6B2_14930 [Babesia caballi]
MPSPEQRRGEQTFYIAVKNYTPHGAAPRPSRKRNAATGSPPATVHPYDATVVRHPSRCNGSCYLKCQTGQGAGR